MRPVYTITFTGAELDLLYELARDARNNLPDPDDIPEPGSWANQVASWISSSLTFITNAADELPRSLVPHGSLG